MPSSSSISRLLLKAKPGRGVGGYLRRCGSLGFLFAVILCAPSVLGQLSTEDHLAEPGFWPTQSVPTRDNLVGSATCAKCHRAKVATQKETPMARAAMSSSLSDILHAHPLMVFSPGKYKYRVETAAAHSQYSVSGGSESLSFPLLWAFGTGRVGQSYLLRRTPRIFSRPGSPTSKPLETSISHQRAHCSLPPASKRLWTVPSPNRRCCGVSVATRRAPILAEISMRHVSFLA